MKTADQIAVMQASLEGKRIESKIGTGEWTLLPKHARPTWNWDACDYRVAEPAPEPRTWELAVHPRFTAVVLGKTPLTPIQRQQHEAEGWTFVHVIEALPGWKPVKEDAENGCFDGWYREWRGVFANEMQARAVFDSARAEGMVPPDAA